MLATCERTDSLGPPDLIARLLWPPDGVNRRRGKIRDKTAWKSRQVRHFSKSPESRAKAGQRPQARETGKNA
jgi:hypothetical protein